MDWRKLLIVTVGVTSCLADLAVAQQLITSAQAKQAVREFENDPSLQVESGGLGQQIEGPAWTHRTWYSMYSVADENADYASWDVDAFSGEVTLAYRDYATLAQEYDAPPGPRTEENCRCIAEAFAHTAYAGFEEIGMVLRDTEWTSTAWRFVWCQRYASGAWTLNEVTVEVNPITGLVSFYNSDRVQESSDRVPQLTSEQAIDRARTLCEIVTPSSTPVTELLSCPDGLIWRIDNVIGTTPEGYQVNYFVSMDADTGALLEREAAFGLAHPRVVWVRELLRGVRNASVEWLGRGKARLLLEGRSYTLTHGVSLVDSGGETIILDGPVSLQNNRLMVPDNLLVALRSSLSPGRTEAGDLRMRRRYHWMASCADDARSGYQRQPHVQLGRQG